MGDFIKLIKFKDDSELARLRMLKMQASRIALKESRLADAKLYEYHAALVNEELQRRKKS